MAIYSDIYGDEFAVLAPGWDPQWGYVSLRTFTGSETAPTGFSLVPVTGSFTMQDGSPASKGRLLFTPSVHSATIGGQSVVFSPFLVDLVDGAVPAHVVIHAPTDLASSVTWTWTVTGRVGETLVSDTFSVPNTSSAWAIGPSPDETGTTTTSTSTVSQEADTLPFEQGSRLHMSFTYKVNGVAQSLSGYTFRGQIRVAEDDTSTLLLDLTSYLAIDGTDSTRLWLDVPSNVTAGVNRSLMVLNTVAWDIFFWPTGHQDQAIRLIGGPVDFTPSVTDMRS